MLGIFSAVMLNMFSRTSGAHGHSEIRDHTRERQEYNIRQAKKFDWYYNPAEDPQGFLVPDTTRHYDGTPRFKHK